jgi:hypothetical protein
MLPTNVSGMQELRWSMPGPYFKLDSTVFYHPRSPSSTTNAIALLAHGHLYTDWDFAHNCFRAAHCWDDVQQRCDLNCRWWDYDNVSTWLHDELQCASPG